MSVMQELGKVSVTPKGEFSAEITYERLDIIEHEGNSYIAVSDVPAGTELTDSKYWQRIASKGDKGDTGAKGPQGDPGPAGADGKDAVVDATLTQAGQAADAAKTGEAIGKLKDDLDKQNGIISDILMVDKSISTDTRYTTLEKKTLKIGKSLLENDFSLDVILNDSNMTILNDKYIIDGSEQWYANGSVNSNGYYRYTWYKFTTDVSFYLSNRLPKSTVSSSDVNNECISLSANGQISIWTKLSNATLLKEHLAENNIVLWYKNPQDTGKKYAELTLTSVDDYKGICVEVNPTEYPYTLSINKNGDIANAVDTTLGKYWYIKDDFSVVGGMYNNIWNIDLVLRYKEYEDKKDIVNDYVIVAKDGSGKYTSIQSAIDSCSDGSTIFVKSGEYEEEVYFGGKQIHLIGEDKYSTILFNTTGDYDHAPLWTNSGIIENITIYAKKDLTKEYPSGVNTCYAVHLDKGWNVDKPYVSFKNCIVKSDFNDAFGSGNISGSVIEISDCFVSATFSSAFKLHPNSGGTEEAKVILRNNVLKSGNGVYDIFCHTNDATYNTVVHAFNNVLKSAIKSNSFTWGDMNYGNALPTLNTLVIS